MIHKWHTNLKTGSARFARIFDHILDYSTYLAWALLTAAFVIVCLEICMRYFLHQPQAWVLETTEYILFYVTFLGAGWILREKGHVNVDIIISHLSQRIQILLNIFTSMLGLLACSALTYFSAATTWDHFQRGVNSLKAMQVPMVAILVVVPFGSLLLSMQFARRINERLREWRVESQAIERGK